MGLADDLRAEAKHKNTLRNATRHWEEQPERYQRQRLEEGAQTINRMMGQLKEREASEGVKEEKMESDDEMDVDEPEPEASGTLYQEDVKSGFQSGQNGQNGYQNGHHQNGQNGHSQNEHSPPQVQDENMFIRDDWWQEWTPEELMPLIAHYKTDMRNVTHGHSGLNHAEVTALRLGELKRLVRRDAKDMLVKMYTSLAREQERPSGPPPLTELQLSEETEGTNLHTGMPRSSQTQNVDGVDSDDESAALVANNTTMLSLLEPQHVTLTEEQQIIFDLVISGQSLFFTGGAGTGKSVLIKEIDQYCERNHIVCKVTAPTGLAAVNVNGITIHRWAGLGLMKDGPDGCVANLLKNPKKAALWKFTDILIIDESSMISASFFDKLDYIARKVRSNFYLCAEMAQAAHDKEVLANRENPTRKKKNTRYAHISDVLNYTEEDKKRDKHLAALPFGGMQVVCVGDFFQLPPVPSFEEKNAYAKLMKKDVQPPSDFLFNSQAFQDVFGGNRLRLTVAKRQAEGSEFAQMLNMFRTYQGTAAESDALRTYFKGFEGRHPEGLEAVHLRATIREVLETNQEELKLLDGPEVCFYSADTTGNGYSPKFIASAMKEFQCEEVIRLKPGAQIMYLVNDYDKGLVNGHMGQVAFLMTPQTYHRYREDLDILFLLYHHIKPRNIRSLGTNAEAPPGIDKVVGVVPLEHHQWAYYRYALMHIDEAYKQSALAQKKKLREMEGKPKPAQMPNSDLLVVFRLADEYREPDGDQFFVVTAADFEKRDYSRMLTEEEQAMYGEKYPLICRRVQLPISLSWAMTIHKAQGQTLIRAVIDMKGIFAEGQAYVAMSRVRAPEDLKLTSFALPKLTSPEVSKFDATIKDALVFKSGGSSDFFTRPEEAPARSSPPPSSYESAVDDFSSGEEEFLGQYMSQPK